ncbi:MAG: DUF4339 domain-containing protein [Planctomycetota bacterium]|nr:MAG: DUF4339 domain-containing protein [Planctomycetota bacterium]
MADQWFYSNNGHQYGPVDASQLKQLASTGQLGVADLVWRDGMPNWLPASSVRGLFSHARLAASPPPLPPSPLAVQASTRPRLREFSVLRLIALPVRIVACVVGFYAMPAFVGWCNPSFDASTADPILRVVMIIVGVGLIVAAWRTTGTVLDMIEAA